MTQLCQYAVFLTSTRVTMASTSWVQAQDQLLDFCAQVHANVKYIDWYWVEVLCPTRHKMVILETFPKPISLLGTEKIT